MGRKIEVPTHRPLFQGFIRGTIGAMAMSGIRQLAVGLGAIEHTPPEKVLHEGVPSFLAAIPENRHQASVELAHWGYGATAGVIFTLLPARVRAWRITGPVYGVLSWGVFEAAIAPALGLAHAHRSRPNERFALMVDHAVFGFILGTLQAANVAGPDRLEGRSLGDEGGSEPVRDQAEDKKASKKADRKKRKAEHG